MPRASNSSRSTARAVEVPGAAKKTASTRAGRGIAPSKSAETPAVHEHDLSSYQGVLAWLLNRVDVERLKPTRAVADLLKLDRMHAILERLDNPHLAIKTVHIAGTKGKGSTCEMTAAALEACGYAVGLYTSPHVTDIRERVRINRRPISPAEFTRVAQSVDAAVRGLDLERFAPPEWSRQDREANRAQLEPTFFELMTAMGFLHFAEQAVDIAVIEVGLGGRLDSTNVVRPEVTAVTQISMDHTQILGSTVELIASEKAGIFKPGVPALTYTQAPSVLEVFAKKAAEVGAPLAVVGRDIEFSQRFENSPGKGPLVRVSLNTARNIYEHISVPLKGEHQALNCGLALAILDRLSERGFSCPETRVTEGLATVELPARLEVVWKQPRVVVDGAHNTDSVRALIKSLGAYVPYDSLVVIFGCAADKDFPGMLKELALGADKVIFTRAGGGSAGASRAADPRDLAKRFVELTGKMAQVAPTLADALQQAQRAVNRDDLVCITGSFYLAGEARKHFQNLGARR